MQLQGKHKKMAIAALIIIGAALLLLYALVDPATHLFPRCVIKSITGIDCPGCGSQRAAHALLHGDIVAAWSYNAFMVTAIPIVALMLLAQAMPRRLQRLHRALNSPAVIWTWFIVIIAWWIGRNIL